jgi:2-oxoglutarate ferredoxin oxidoreductase subunit delta
MIQINIDFQKCKACEYCVSICPKHVLALGEAVNSKGYHSAEVRFAEACVGCAMCAIMCPEAAIEILKSKDKLSERSEQ